MESHNSHHEEDEVVLEIKVTRGGLVHTWHSPRLTKETVRQLAEHLTSWEESKPDTDPHEDECPFEEGAA